ncbi:MAG: DsbC family protein [Pseudomonadota bacterium]
MKFLPVLAALLVLAAPTVHADTDADIAQLRDALGKAMPDLPLDSVKASPIPGLLEVVTGAQVFYFTPDAKYVVEGSIIDVERRVNLTQQRQGRTQLAAINALGDAKMVIYRPDSDADRQRSITVFTDTTCPYCSRLHLGVPELLSQGISVRYLLYPRAGLNSPAHETLTSVWCADDPLDAMTKAKAGESIEQKSCENPIVEHIAMARQVGLQGTPHILLDNGLVIPGYRPPDELVRLLASEPRI